MVAEASNPRLRQQGENTAAVVRDWRPVSTGPAHAEGNVSMRESIQSAISASYGVPGLYHRHERHRTGHQGGQAIDLPQ